MTTSFDHRFARRLDSCLLLEPPYATWSSRTLNGRLWLPKLLFYDQGTLSAHPVSWSIDPLYEASQVLCGLSHPSPLFRAFACLELHITIDQVCCTFLSDLRCISASAFFHWIGDRSITYIDTCIQHTPCPLLRYTPQVKGPPHAFHPPSRPIHSPKNKHTCLHFHLDRDAFGSGTQRPDIHASIHAEHMAAA